MAGVTKREFWDFRVKTRAQFTKLAEQIANIDTSGGGGISELTSKMVVDALGYTPYNANNPANYITSAALAPYLKTEDAEGTYATKDFVNNKLVNYAPLTSVQGFENRIGGLESAVPQLNDRVTTVEGKVSTLNETVSTGKNNLLDRVNVIEEEYATKTYVDNAIDGIDLSPYLKTEDAEGTYATKDFVNNKLTNYATTNSVTAIQNTLTGQIGAVDARVEQLAATKLDSSYFTLTNIKSTLGISDWALAATKPSYAWSEITSRPTALSQFTDDVVDGKYLPLSGGILTYNVWCNGDQNCTGFFGKNIKFASATGWAREILRLDVDNKTKFSIGGYGQYTPDASDNESNGYVYIGCNKYNGANLRLTPSSIQWGGYNLIHAGNIKSTLGISDWALAATKPSYTASEVGATPSFGDVGANSVKGNGLGYTYATSAHGGYAPGGFISFGNAAYGCQLNGSFDGDILAFRGLNNGTFTSWKTLAFTDSNVASATKLQTARTLWGQSFDGTDKVSGDINNAAGGIYIHKTSEINSFNGKLYLNHHGSGLSGYGSTNDIVMVANGGNVSIGKVYAGSTAKLQIDTTATTNWAGVAEFLSDSLTDTHIQIGRSLSTKNSAFLAYHHTSANSNLNYTGIGFYGGGYLVKIYADGSIEIGGVKITASNGSITVNGNVFATGDITGGV